MVAELENNEHAFDVNAPGEKPITFPTSIVQPEKLFGDTIKS